MNPTTDALDYYRDTLQARRERLRAAYAEITRHPLVGHCIMGGSVYRVYSVALLLRRAVIATEREIEVLS